MIENDKQESLIQVYVTPIMKVALEMASEKEERSLSNFMQRSAYFHAKNLGITLDAAKERYKKNIEDQKDAKQPE